MDAKGTVDLIYSILIVLMFMGSFFLNVWLVNLCRYRKICTRSEEYQVEYWKGTALLYQKQMHEAVDRHWETLDKMAERV